MLTFNFCRRENVLTTNHHKGTRDNLVKPKSRCECVNSATENSKSVGVLTRSNQCLRVSTMRCKATQIISLILH